jgi:hypothetical protein
MMMEITKAEAASIAWCMHAAHDEARLCASQLELMLRLARFAELPAKTLAIYERQHKHEADYEAAEEAEDERIDREAAEFAKKFEAMKDKLRASISKM